MSSSLALMVANPLPKHNHILPQEHLINDNNNITAHPLYTLPPLISHSNRQIQEYVLLNANLVIVPIIWCSQWWTELEKFAPWMRVLALLGWEWTDLGEITSSDVVIFWTLQMQNSKKFRDLLRFREKIHL